MPIRHSLTFASASLHRRNPANTLPASRLLSAASATTAPRPTLPARSCCLSFSTAAVAVASRQRWNAVTSTSLERRAARRATCRSAACRVKSCVKGAGSRSQGPGRRAQGAGRAETNAIRMGFYRVRIIRTAVCDHATQWGTLIGIGNKKRLWGQ